MNGHLRLRIKLPWGEEQLIPVHEETLYMGRDPDCEIEISDPEVSRRHVKLTSTRSNKIIVTDLESTNGTFYNGKPITSDKKLSAGSTFSIGETHIVIESIASEAFELIHIPAVHAQFHDYSKIESVDDDPEDFNSGTLMLLAEFLMGTTGLHNLDPILTQITTLLNAENGFLVLYDADGWKHHCTKLNRGKSVFLPIEIMEAVIEQGNCALIETAGKKEFTVLKEKGTGSAVCAAMSGKNRIVGCIYLDRGKKRKAFTLEDVNLLSQLTNLAALALGKEQMLSELAAEKDSLLWEREQINALARKSSEATAQSKNRKFQQFLFKALRVAATVRPLLLIGSRGSGRSQIARRIHDASARKDKPFIVLNCDVIPPAFLEDELFGFTAGSDTPGSRKPCLLESANGGTLYIHELSSLSHQLQHRLAKVLKEKQFLRTRDHAFQPADIRLIACTDVEMSKLSSLEVLHPEFYSLLENSELEVPSLKQRKEDILSLAKYYLRNNIPKNRRVPDFSQEAIEILEQYPWPGNIEEMAHIMRYIAATCRDQHVEVGDLPRYVRENATPQIDFSGSLRDQMDRIECEIIRHALGQNKMIVTRAASDLGMSESTLRYRMHRLKIAIDKNA
jgi:DNA-binding NtrC family response regulator